jgi:hypothetical protein
MFLVDLIFHIPTVPDVSELQIKSLSASETKAVMPLSKLGSTSSPTHSMIFLKSEFTSRTSNNKIAFDEVPF